jgi:hypothetical protein
VSASFHFAFHFAKSKLFAIFQSAFHFANRLQLFAFHFSNSKVIAIFQSAFHFAIRLQLFISHLLLQLRIAMKSQQLHQLSYQSQERVWGVWGVSPHYQHKHTFFLIQIQYQKMSLEILRYVYHLQISIEKKSNPKRFCPPAKTSAGLVGSHDTMLVPLPVYTHT